MLPVIDFKAKLTKFFIALFMLEKCFLQEKKKKNEIEEGNKPSPRKNSSILKLFIQIMLFFDPKSNSAEIKPHLHKPFMYTRG